MLSIKTKNVVMVLIAGLVLTVAFAIANECIDGDANAGNVVMGVPLGNTTIYVPDDYPTIQSAVDNATDRDTIIVRDGNYTENIDIKKPLTVRSENGSAYTFVTAADSDDHIFKISSNYVNVSGFTVNGSNLAGSYLIFADCCNISDINASNNEYGLYLYKSSNNTIRNNFASDNDYGIFLDVFSSNNTVSNNTANWNGGGIQIYSNGNIIQNNSASHNSIGIYLYDSDSNTIANNNVSNNGYGIYLYHRSDGNTITNINASNNGGDGIYLVSSGSNTITNINASNNNYGIFLSSSGSNTITNINASNNNYGIYLVSSGSNTITNINASNNNYGIFLSSSGSNTITNINASNNGYHGIHLDNSDSNTITNNNASNNGYYGICLDFSEDNIISNNTLLDNNWYGIYLDGSNNNILTHNNASGNDRGICLGYSNNNIISNNIASNNEYGIYAFHSSNGKIYLNNFINNTDNVDSYDSTNIWNSTSKIVYTYNGSTYTNYLGNYWDGYNGSDTDGDGIGDTPHSINGNNDSYPLMEWFENYTIQDITPPEIVNIEANPNQQEVGEWVNISTTVTDNVGVNVVKVNIAYPDGSIINVTMTAGSYYYNTTYTILGTYYYFIWANDTSGNENHSTTYTFLIISPTFVNITPPSQSVSTGETFTVNITIDPWEPIGGAQTDLLFDSSLITVNSVTDGGMFGMWFDWNLEIDNVNGAVRNISAIDFGSVNTPGVFAIIEFTAGSIDGTSPLNLTNVIVGHPDAYPVDIAITNGSVTIILDAMPPEIIDDTLSDAYSGDLFTFNATVTDNIQVSTVWVEYWYGTGNHTNVSMNNVADNYWEKEITIPSDSTATLHYIISANDTSNNWNDTGIKDVTIYPTWDVNMDGSVNVLDLIIVAMHWGETGEPGWIRADVNKDGVINILDLILIGQYWTG